MSLLPVYLLQISYGMNTGYPAIVTPQLEEPCSEFKVTPDQESWIVSLDNSATPVVCILSGFLQQYFGPLRVLVFACFPYAGGWLIAALANSPYHLYLSRILVGVSNALLTTTVYTVEVASKEMRGTYSLLEAVLRCFGCLLIYCLGYVMRWQTVATFGWVVPVAACVTCLTCASESPVFLIASDKLDKARKTLYRLYGPHYKVDEEVEIIRANLKERNCGKSGRRRHTSSVAGCLRKLTKNPEVYKPFLIVLFLCVVQQFSGMSVLRAYVVKIFNEVFNHHSSYYLPFRTAVDLSKQLNASSTSMLMSPLSGNSSTVAGNSTDCQNGHTSSKAYLSAIVMGFVRLVASLVLSKLIRIYRRRAMYFFSAIATCTSLFCFATCNYVVSHYDNHATDPLSPTVETALKWASLVTACTLVFSVQLGVQTLPFLLSGELFPSDVRAFCKGLTRSAASLLIVANLKLYNNLLEPRVGIGGAYYLYTAVIAASFPVVYFILPETKDLGLEVIQDYFKPQRTIFYVDCLESSGNPNNRARLLSCGNPDPVSGKNSPTNAAMDSGCESQCSNDFEFNSSQKTSQKFDLIS